MSFNSIDDCDIQEVSPIKYKNIKHFDLNSIKIGRTTPFILVIGPRCCGKSYLISNIAKSLIENNSIDNLVYFSCKQEENTIKYSDEILQQIIDYQVKRVLDAREKNEHEPSLLLIFDDIHKINLQFVMDQRHFRMSCIVSMQYPIGLPPEIRCCADYIFIFRQFYMLNIKKLYNDYCGMFRSLNEFIQVMNKCTNNYNTLVVSKSYESKCYKYINNIYDPHFNLFDKVNILDYKQIDNNQNNDPKYIRMNIIMKMIELNKNILSNISENSLDELIIMEHIIDCNKIIYNKLV
jgi:hypothetical protein